MSNANNWDSPLISDGHDPAGRPEKHTVRRDRRTVQLAVFTLVAITFFAGVALAAGVWLAVFSSRKDGRLLLSTGLSSTFVSFSEIGVNALVTLSVDGVGFIHATSLRWALYREQRLEYNTNMRLFTTSRREFSNGWTMNITAIASLVLCYASTSALWIRRRESEDMSVNAMAVLLIGCGLLIQAFVGLICFRGHRRLIGTWSSSPLDNALVAVGEGSITRRDGRCMLPFTAATEPSLPQYPRKKQSSLLKMRSTKVILVFLWALVLAITGWFAGLVKIMVKDWRQEWQWHWTNPDPLYTHALQFGEDSPVRWDTPPTFNAQIMLVILFLCALQGFQAVGLHCLELLVNLSRDEKMWRAASSTSGARLGSLPLSNAVRNWPNVLLFGLKALLHWLMGVSMFPHYTEYGMAFEMSSSRLLLYAIGTLISATFATFLAAKRPKGAQPAAFGHLQTIVDCVDEWSDKMWWGDKPELEKLEEDGIATRHAGFSGYSQGVGMVVMDAMYM